MADTAPAAQTMDLTEEQMARLYEVTILYPANLAQKEEQQLQKEFDEIMKEAGAEFVDKDVWKKRGLAYPIKGHREGRYVIMYYTMAPDKVKEVDNALRIVPNMLRHLIVKPPKDFEMVKYSEVYEAWIEFQKTQSERQEKEEEEEIKKKIVKKATKKVTPQKTEEVDSTETPKIADKLEELISDEDLNL